MLTLSWHCAHLICTCDVGEQENPRGLASPAPLFDLIFIRVDDFLHKYAEEESRLRSTAADWTGGNAARPSGTPPQAHRRSPAHHNTRQQR